MTERSDGRVADGPDAAPPSVLANEDAVRRQRARLAFAFQQTEQATAPERAEAAVHRPQLPQAPAYERALRRPEPGDAQERAVAIDRGDRVARVQVRGDERQRPVWRAERPTELDAERGSEAADRGVAVRLPEPVPDLDLPLHGLRLRLVRSPAGNAIEVGVD